MKPTLMRLLVAASLAMAPFAFAHSPAGTPDFTCQTPDEWDTHDYAGANGRTVAFISDNNLEECGTTYGLFVAGTPECRRLEDQGAADPSSPLHALWLLLCQTDRPADYDGDLEFALGGALLAVESGDGQTSGSLVCLGTLGHHSNTISVDDEVFGTNVAFTVGADASLVPPVPGEPDCGDNVTRPCEPNNSGLGPTVDAVLDLLNTGTCNPNDHRVLCVDTCAVPFGPGAEGTYVVWVHPTLNAGPGGTPTGASHGHVSSTRGDGGLSLGFACRNGVDDDLDGAADHPDDPDCTSPEDPSETCLPEGCTEPDDPDPVGEPAPDLEDPTTNAPPVSNPGVGDESAGTQQHCGFSPYIHVHGTRKYSWHHGYYWDGPTYAHVHHCPHHGEHMQSYRMTTCCPYTSASHDSVKVTWPDARYHQTCIEVRLNNGTVLALCWKQRN